MTFKYKNVVYVYLMSHDEYVWLIDYKQPCPVKSVDTSYPVVLIL